MIVSQLMERMLALWPRQFENPETAKAWADEYYRSLNQFQGEKLERAWAAVMDGWKLRSAPTPGEILKHIPEDRVSASPSQAAWSEREKAIREVMHGNVGGVAAEEGWAGWLDVNLQGGWDPAECTDVDVVRRRQQRVQREFDLAMRDASTGAVDLSGIGKAMTHRAAHQQDYWCEQHALNKGEAA